MNINLEIDKNILSSVISRFGALNLEALSQEEAEFYFAAKKAIDQKNKSLLITPVKPDRVAVIRIVRMLTGLGLKEAKDLVDSYSIHHTNDDGTITTKKIKPFNLENFNIEEGNRYSVIDVCIVEFNDRVI